MLPCIAPASFRIGRGGAKVTTLWRPDRRGPGKLVSASFLKLFFLDEVVSTSMVDWMDKDENTSCWGEAGQGAEVIMRSVSDSAFAASRAACVDEAALADLLARRDVERFRRER